MNLHNPHNNPLPSPNPNLIPQKKHKIVYHIVTFYNITITYYSVKYKQIKSFYFINLHNPHNNPPPSPQSQLNPQNNHKILYF